MLSLNGCLTVDTYVSKRGHITRVYTLQVPADHAASARAELERYLGPKGWKFQRTEVWPGTVQLTYRRKFKGRKGLPYIHFARRPLDRLGFCVEYEYRERLVLTKLLAREEERKLAQLVPVTFHLHLPGKIAPEGTNASQIEGNMATWEFSLHEAEGKEFKAVSRAKNWWRMGGLLLLFAIVLGVVVYVVWPGLVEFGQVLKQRLFPPPEERERRRRERAERAQRRGEEQEAKRRQREEARAEKQRRKEEARRKKEPPAEEQPPAK